MWLFQFILCVIACGALQCFKLARFTSFHEKSFKIRAENSDQFVADPARTDSERAMIGGRGTDEIKSNKVVKDKWGDDLKKTVDRIEKQFNDTFIQLKKVVATVHSSVEQIEQQLNTMHSSVERIAKQQNEMHNSLERIEQQQHEGHDHLERAAAASDVMFRTKAAASFAETCARSSMLLQHKEE